MIKQHRMILSLVVPFVTLAIGCEISSFPNSVPVSLEDVNAIRADSDLTAAEKRAGLERLGIDTVTINAILVDDRTGNQFGGDLESAHAKVSGQRLNDLTADEVQIYADAASDEDSSFIFDSTDQEAAATVNLFVENNIASTDALSTFINDSSNVIPAVIPEDFLNNVFLDFDPSLLLDQLP